MSILRGGIAIVKHTAASGSFTIPTPPTPAAGTAARYAPNFTALATGKCPYRQHVKVQLDGIPFFCNGHDAPWYWDRENAAIYDMGSVAPTSFAATANTGGSAHAAGTSFVYRCEFYNSRVGKATTFQELTVTHATLTFDVDVTWTDPVGEWDGARIYRRRQGDETFALVSTVTISDEAYKDSLSEIDLETGDITVRRYRATLPPVFKGMAGHLGRLWGWTGLDSKLYYSQRVRVDSEFVLDDFPTANVVQIGAEDGYGEIVGVISHYSFLYILKRRAIYELAGDDAGNFDLRLLYGERGCLSQRTAIPVQDRYSFIDEEGLMLWTPGGEPRIAGATPGKHESAIASIWKRVNRSVADLATSVHHEAEGEIEIHVPLDHSPIPDCRIIYDVRADRFTSVEYGVYATAVGYLDDASGVEHLCRGDDLGFLWEQYAGNSEGVHAGDTTANLSAATQLLLTSTGSSLGTATLTGPEGTPLDVYDASGDVASENRVYTNTATTVVPLFPVPAAVDSTYTTAVGVIPAVWRIGWLNFYASKTKSIPRVYVKCEATSGASTLRVDTAVDGGSFANKAEIDLTSTRLLKVPVGDRGDVWSLQGSQRYAGMDFAVSLLEIQYRVAGVP